MRITQSMMSSSMMKNLQNNYKRLDKYQEQLMTNRRLNRPSDDPVGVASALHYRAEISSTTQFSENVDDADSFLKFTDTVMNEATQIVQKLSELAVQGGTDTVPKDARENIAREVEQLYTHLVSLGNTQFKGRYIFNGQRTDQKPYPDDPANEKYSLDDGIVQYQVGAGIYVDVNMLGDKVFGKFGDADNIFTIVNDMKTALLNDNTSGISGAIPKLQGMLEKLVIGQAEVGAKQNRLEFTTSRLEDLNLNYIDLQSKTEDIDMPKVITELKTAESIFQASLDTIARISRPSLLDFLR
ncbi:flagellar hook-associated protein FlgL [Paenibacillus alvei]|uniref:Flagellar hook-associated protein FlgL n=1 Tax=Paenibacillus alvei TaxID=44250 RepID=A0ABT4GSA1_PAEAL|nr:MULTISPECIES: flagellar hook-associated protein FlgL [Paenibacillus]EJW18411.1 flagellar hook-associated protein 3 [Paenibacillus alvei DSM 29]MCY7485247.1 flagellar hook-associated protein FlgL [Paenibacillus alvei]MCY9540283.1 flagellar hook-associated protein FlgL [Paenibacillus alvei]MCY9703106.1 flagellar hook-associated protein FlgL [Paenibacillus alvei]MCY9735673.1 flagellar hook-associated protein FlgL [Paenibacillus alvei]